MDKEVFSNSSRVPSVEGVIRMDCVRADRSLENPAQSVSIPMRKHIDPINVGGSDNAKRKL